MVTSIIGKYLVNQGLLSEEQLSEVIKEQGKARVKLGLIAVSEGLMKQSEADRVNQLQAIMDKRFGDIAVEQGYLTSGQVESLLKKQGNAYLSFAQALENLELLNVEQLEFFLMDYGYDNNFTASDIEAIKSDDVNRIIPVFLPLNSEKYLTAAGIAVRTLMRLVDTDLYIGKAYLTTRMVASNGALQRMDGKEPVTCSMVGRGNNLLHTASVFGQEEFEQVDEDALDAIGELLNCINGLYASALSAEGVSLELLPPAFSTQMNELEADEMLVIPVYIKDTCIYFGITIGCDMKIN